MIFIKTIGIIIREFDENNKKIIGTRNDLFKTLYEYNINLIGIPISNNFNNIINVVNLCDGIILSGGDEFLDNDFLLVNYLYQNDIPTLGICLGMQAMGRYFSNVEEVNILNHSSDDLYVHNINIEKSSLLSKIIKKKNILVNSRHKSALVKTNLCVSARSDDFVIEAIEDVSKKFFLGVQWHPETLEDINTKRLFAYFINIL